MTLLISRIAQRESERKIEGLKKANKNAKIAENGLDPLTSTELNTIATATSAASAGTYRVRM